MEGDCVFNDLYKNGERAFEYGKTLTKPWSTKWTEETCKLECDIHNQSLPILTDIEAERGDVKWNDSKQKPCYAFQLHLDETSSLSACYLYDRKDILGKVVDAGPGLTNFCYILTSNPLAGAAVDSASEDAEKTAEELAQEE